MNLITITFGFSVFSMFSDKDLASVTKRKATPLLSQSKNSSSTWTRFSRHRSLSIGSSQHHRTLTRVQEHSGIVVDRLSQRKAELIEMKPVGGQNRIRLVFTIPSRGLIGYQSEFRNSTRGTGVLTRLFKGYDKFKGVIESRRNGSLISSATGTRCSDRRLMDVFVLCSGISYRVTHFIQRVVCSGVIAGPRCAFSCSRCQSL